MNTNASVAADTPTTPSAKVGGQAAMSPLRIFLEEWSLILIFIALFAVLSLTVEYFFSIQNLVGLALSVSQIGMVACTMMFCLACRDFDLSVGSIVAFSGLLCATVISSSGSIALGIGASLVAGAFIGAVNGVIIAKVKINALITTLAMMEIVRGLGFIVSGGQAIGISNEAFFEPAKKIVNELKLRASYGSLGISRLAATILI